METLNKIFKSPLKMLNRPFSKGKTAQQSLSKRLKLAGSDDEKQRITSLINRAAQSPFGKEILEQAAALKYTVGFGDLGTDTRGSCKAEMKLLLLSPHFQDDSALVTLVHEARHASQIARGAIAGYSPDYTFLSQLPHKRLMEADAVACSIAVASDLAALGDQSALKSAAVDYGKMVQAYEKASKDGKSVPEAMTACAMAWYAHQGLKISYEKTHVMEPIADASYVLHDGKQKEISLAESVRKICTYGSENYFSAPVGVLSVPARAGISSLTDWWIQTHIKAAEKLGADVRPYVSGLPVYKTPFQVLAKADELYKRFPKPLPEKGKNRLRIGLKLGRVAAMPVIRKKIFQVGKDR